MMTNKYRMVEGGQLFMHRIRMLKQTMKVVFGFSFLAIAILLIALILLRFDWYDCYMGAIFVWAKIKLSLKPLIPRFGSFVDFYTRDLTLMRANSFNFVHDPFVVNVTNRLLETFKEVALYTPFLVLMSVVGALKFFGSFSKKQRKLLTSKEILRGQELATPKELGALLQKKRMASDLKLDKLPLVKNKETSHILVTGTTGSGKSNCFNTLLPQVRNRGNKAIIIDTTGAFVSKYFRHGYDIILNPLDERSQAWNIWQECQTEEELASFAEAFIPPKGGRQDPFWENAGRSILKSAIKGMRGQRDIEYLYHLLIRSDLDTYHSFFEGTDAATYTEKEGGKTTLSIRSTLSSCIDCVKPLVGQQGEEFSIKNWVKDSSTRDQWLFISSTPTQRDLLRPLMSAWLNIAANGLMALEPDEERRVWLVIDELPSLNNIPSLKTGLSEFRKYGGCILAGIQNFPQLSDIYGSNVSQTMLDLFNTKLIFRTGDPGTSQWAAKVLGEIEYAESQENLSFGANSVRDGVSLARSERVKQLILPSEVNNLNDLECFVKYPGSLPATRLAMKYKKLPSQSQAFIEKTRESQTELVKPQTNSERS